MLERTLSPRLRLDEKYDPQHHRLGSSRLCRSVENITLLEIPVVLKIVII